MRLSLRFQRVFFFGRQVEHDQWLQALVVSVSSFQGKGISARLSRISCLFTRSVRAVAHRAAGENPLILWRFWGSVPLCPFFLARGKCDGKRRNRGARFITHTVTGASFDLINALSLDLTGANIEIEGLRPGFQYAASFSNGAAFTLIAENNGVSTAPEANPFWLVGAVIAVSALVRRMNLKGIAASSDGRLHHEGVRHRRFHEFCAKLLKT